MRTIAIVLLAAAACGKREARPAIAAAPVIDAAPAPVIDAPPDAHEAAFAHDPSADLRALGAALEDDDDDGDNTAKVGALLVDWDRSGEVAHLDCDASPAIGAGLHAIRDALERATSADDPIVHAIVRFGHALESRDNAPLGIALGIQLAIDVAEWRQRRGLPETDDMRAFAPTDELPRRAALAETRCQEGQLATLRAALAADPHGRELLIGARREDGLDTDGDPIEADVDAAAAYIAGTRDAIVRTPTDGELREVLDRRYDRAVRDSRSELARVVALPFAFQKTQEAIARYRAIADGREPPEP